MIEAEWWDYDDATELAEAVAGDVGFIIEQALEARGIEHVDAPVSGGPAGAQGATLSIMAGGKPEVFERVKPLFACLGKTILHMGGHGAGQVTKACNQLALTITAQAAAEALSLARECGLDPARVHEALMGGVAASRVLELAQEAGLPLPAGAVVKQQINALMGAGDGGADFSVLIRALERSMGKNT